MLKRNVLFFKRFIMTWGDWTQRFGCEEVENEQLFWRTADKKLDRGDTVRLLKKGAGLWEIRRLGSW